MSREAGETEPKAEREAGRYTEPSLAESNDLRAHRRIAAGGRAAIRENGRAELAGTRREGVFEVSVKVSRRPNRAY